MRTTLYALVLLAYPLLTLEAQPEIYLSFSGLGDGDAINNTNANFNVGSSGSVYVWIDDDSTASGLVGTDFVVGSNDLLITAAEVFNPSLEIEQMPIGLFRWDGTDESIDSDGQGVFLTGLGGGAGGVGIQPQFDGTGILDDPLHDPLSNAFLFARVDFDVLDEGTTELFLRGTNFINADGEIFPQTGGVTITTTVPEPTTGYLAFMITAVYGCSRKHTRRTKNEKCY